MTTVFFPGGTSCVSALFGEILKVIMASHKKVIFGHAYPALSSDHVRAGEALAIARVIAINRESGGRGT
jgi:hypothetical protein